MKVLALQLPAGVRSRIFTVLAAEGIETTEQLAAIPAKRLMKWPNFGQISVNAISHAMHGVGYQWPPKPKFCPHCYRPMP